MIEGQTPNTVELANLSPLRTERQDLREQWLKSCWQLTGFIPRLFCSPGCTCNAHLLRELRL